MKEMSRKNHTSKTVMLTDPCVVVVEIASMKIITILARGMSTDRIVK